MALPEGWTILTFSSEDMAQILKSMSDKNPAFRRIADNFKPIMDRIKDSLKLLEEQVPSA